MAAWLLLPMIAGAQTPAPASRAAADSHEAQARILLSKGAEFLLASQEKQGGWESDKGPGITALAAKALAQEPAIGPRHPAVRRAVVFVMTSQHDDGGIYSALGLFKNYETSVAVSMLSTLGDAAPAGAIDKARKFLIDNQADDDRGVSVDDVWYGGAGYFFGKRPDLSNTQLMLDALKDSGLPPSDPAFQKALVFIGRCQMLGEYNSQPLARGSTAGGFIYSAAGGGESKADTEVIEGRKELRCYGSMTYAGLKSMIYAGLKKDDPRVRAALAWVQDHWTLDSNPNMPEKKAEEGLFYFYHTFARALTAWGERTIRDRLGRDHDWRAELVEALAKRQKDDGSWLNPADRWMEGYPALTTAYAMLALQAAYPQTQPTTAP
ncbi:MAG: terpene cyclase/mutase family protein [Planctomycetes bacterium]|nr:terpene cyclase/mutase family protein [Planctomycetota bacterium]